ncbi:T9SS type A sorting domain-containing protein [Kaistella antarctica]|uniref:Por secretion system C-terminal sorting domain n=1 Tax=Kaistella antarctica TaxID=266748 RepID=A0A3S4YJY7_9FLAO|nr:T9SS type A sorting domain-containing protein [Kaistella antarctica]KEY18804.1 hypothetical protein HY04_10045 [Kaistella antarctica]SEW15232.1 Por secretion system C-terminal sorting domain-containing protein [Kaistella antarctica]VEH99474.1 Por secretion system C-terminal sorting domain [Kaistella antarctica]
MIKYLHSKIALFLCLVFIVTSGEVSAQKTVFSDNFNTSFGENFTKGGQSIGASKWAVTSSGNGGYSARIHVGVMTITNNGLRNGVQNGWVLASTSTVNNPADPTSYDPTYKTTLNQNAGIVSWTLNIRQSHPTPRGFGIGNDQYGVAYLLAGTLGTTNAVGQGYAIQIGGNSGNESLRLVRYTNGMSTATTILSSQSTGPAKVGYSFMSVRVEYNPQTEEWKLFARVDANTSNASTSNFKNPSEVLPLKAQGTHTDSYTNRPLTLTGGFWNGGNTSNDAFIDNVEVSIALPEITSITPSSKTAATAGFTMTVTGKNFSGSSKVNWNGQERTTTYVSPTQINATITAADIAVSGTATVTVKTKTAISNEQIFTTIPSGQPILTLPNTTLDPMETVQGTASTAKTYTLRGDNLTAGATVTAPANFELSSNGSVWSDVLTLPNTGGGLTGQPLTLQARLKANALAGVYGGTISHASAGAATKFVTVSGKVFALKPTTRATDIKFSDITSTTFKINWTNGNGSQRLVVVKKATAVNVDPANGTTYEGNAVYKIGSNLGAENYVVYKGTGTSVSLKGLEPDTVYHVSVIEFNGADEVENYLTPGTPASTTTKISPSGLQVNAVDTSYKIDFDQTVDGVNSEAFKGEGIRQDVQPGQLDSDSWAFTGFAAGDLGFGENSVAGTSYEMGSSMGNTPASGIYGFNIGTSSENYALGIHPGGADFNSGTITLKVQNKTAVPMTSVNIGYKVYVYNDQASATKIEFSTSTTENGAFTTITSLEVNSPATPDLNPDWKASYRVATISELSVAPGEYYYIRWNGSSTAGSAAQDEFAIDDIEVIANPTSTFASFAGIAEDFVLQGNARLPRNLPEEASGDLTVKTELIFNGGKLFINNNTLTIASNVTNTSAGGLSGGLMSKIIIRGNNNPSLSFNQGTPGTTNGLQSLSLLGTTANTVIIQDDLLVSNLLHIDGLQTLNFPKDVKLMGNLSTIENNGTITTRNTTINPLPSNKDWGSTGEVHYNNPAANASQTIVSGTYNNLTVSPKKGSTARGNITVRGQLHLPNTNASATKGSLDMSTHTLTMEADAVNSGIGEVTGRVTRNSFVFNKLYTFGHPNASITFAPAGTLPSTMSAILTIGNAPTWRPGAIKRFYDVMQTGASGTKAIIRQHYLDSELNGNAENRLVNWGHKTTTDPVTTFEQGKSNNDSTDNWVEITNADVSLYFQSEPGKVFITLDETEATVLTWNGSVSNSWTTSENWTPLGTPSALTKVIIPNVTGLPHQPILNLTGELGSLVIEDGGILNSPVDAELIMIGGAGAWQNYGSGKFNPSTSNVIFKNIDATISGSTTFNDLTIFSGAGLRALDGNFMSIAGAFVNNGTMFTALTPNTIQFIGTNQNIPTPGGLAFGGYHHLIIGNAVLGTGAVFPSNLNVIGNLEILKRVDFSGTTINLTGITPQTISGTVIDFNNLVVNKDSGSVILGSNITISGTLNLQSGNIDIKNRTLTLGQTPVVGNFDTNHMIIADGTGSVRRTFKTKEAYLFPIGDDKNTLDYSPITVNITSGTFADGLVAVSVSDEKHPANASTDHHLKRYWNVSQTGISNAVATITGTYVPTDLVGDESSLAAGQLQGTFNAVTNPWKKFAPLATNTLVAKNTLLPSGENSVFTGIKGGEFSVEIYGYGGFCQGSQAFLEAVTDGGDAPFTYIWSHALPNENVVSVPTDVVGTINYTVTVRDANGFEATEVVGPVEVFAPSVGGTVTITNPVSCSTTLELSGKLGEVLYWQRSTTIDFTEETTLNIGNTTSTLTNREIGIIDAPIYFRAVVQNGPCGQVVSDVVAIATNSTTWNGTAWTNNAPTPSSSVIFAANYETSAGGLTICNFRVNEGFTLTIKKDSPMTVQNDIINYGDIIVESDANLVQVSDTGEYRTNPLLNSLPTFTVQREATIKRLDYVYWSSPVADQNLRAFSPGTIITRFLAYDESDDYFKAIFPAEGPTDNPATKVFSPAKGYAIRAKNNQNATTSTAWPGQFVGKPNNGVVNFNLKKDGNGYNLVGNPYASNIKLKGDNSLFSQNAAVIDQLAYFWTNVSANVTAAGSGYTQNNYAILNGLGSIAAPGNPETEEVGTEEPTTTAKVGQGFIVKAKEAGKNQNLVFKNSIRNAGESIFFDKKQEEEKDRFWLRLTTPNQYSTTMLVGYVPTATNGFEYSYDAPLMSVGSDSFFSVLEDRKLGIQGRQYPLNTNDVVALGTNHYVAGDHVISLQKAEGIFANGQNIYLKDKKTNTVTNLSAGNYTFAAVEGLTEGRFEIIYENDIVLGTGSSNKDELMVYRDGTDFIIKSASKKISEVEVYDTSGRLMIKLNPNQTEVRIEGQALINSVYVLKIYQNGKVTTRKIIR